MNPSFLRRFGAALVCSLILAVAGAPPALATNADSPPAGRGDTESKKSHTDTGSDAAKANPGETNTKRDSGDAAKLASDAPDPAGEKPASEAADRASEKPASDAADRAGEKTASDSAKPGAGATSPNAGGRVLKSSAQAQEEAQKEGRRHGARSKGADGTLLVWDNVNSVWIAAEAKDTYWVDDTYYRFDQGLWLKSKLLKGPWELTASRFVPEAPRHRHGDPEDTVTATLPSGGEAVWEPSLRVFKVAGRNGVFLFDSAFYRYDGGVWLESGSPDGPWTHTSSVGLPAALRRALTPPEKGARVTLPNGDVLVSEGEPNLFAVESRPDALYFDGTFYERRDEKWFRATNVASEWEEISSQKIPGTVRSNYHTGGNKKDAKGSGKPGDKKKRAARGGRAADDTAGAKRAGASAKKRAAAE